MSAVPQSVTTTPSALASASGAAPKPTKPDQPGFTFDDFLDIINPLQHLPVVSTLYRRLTGDQMGPTAEIAGGALYGGVLGFVSSIADVIWTQATGRDFGNTVMAWLGMDDKDASIQLARATPPPTSGQDLAIADISPMTDLQIGTPATQLAEVNVAPLPDLQILRPSVPVASDFEPDLPALIDAMERVGVDPDVAVRAAAAYRNAIGLKDLPNISAVPAF